MEPQESKDVKSEAKPEASLEETKPETKVAKTEAKSEPPPPSSSKSEESPASTNGSAVALAASPRDEVKKKKGVEYAIRATKVVKRFGPKTAVDGVTLKIKAGSVYGLIGPNGAGKTTTFSMLAGFLEPTEGSLEVLGFAPTQVDSLRSRIGVLPQDALLPNSDKVGEFLIHMARLQNIPADKAEAAVRTVLEEVDGKDWWNLRCSALSHGMAKRVAIAQAFLGEPEVVLLDEPTAGLDPRVAWEIRQVIRARKGRCTLVVSSHNLQELEEICDAAAILDRGRVVASGSINELTASSEEVHVELASAPVGLDALRQVPGVTRVEHQEMDAMGYRVQGDGELVIHFDKKLTNAESVIGQCLWILLQNQVRISGVSKGRGLERRVMELTD
ncbi:MAG: ABC transporter ATP-binding protein [Polyangiaceae bacterium]|nr:ABC transporter ATP-binding protein [Polyangiaceae bacterium]